MTRVLVVERDRHVRDALTDALHESGYDVLAMSSSTEAMKRRWSSASVPDLLVLDLAPTGPRATELLAAIRNRAKSHVPVLFVTRAPRRSKRFGSAPVLGPPFKPVRVLAAVDELVLESKSPRSRRTSGKAGTSEKPSAVKQKTGIKAQSPRRAGVESRVPRRMEIEGAHILADEVRRRLRREGFTDDAIDRWTDTFISEEGPGEYDVEDLIRWIRRKEGLDQ